jgi:hypothetical protein
MALYRPDYQYLEAKKIIEELTDSEKDTAIKYYIKKHDEWHKADKERLNKYQKFFETLNAFLPKSGMRLG